MTKEQRNEKILKAIDEATAKGTVSKEKARDTLVSEGIYTPKGDLKAEFGGESIEIVFHDRPVRRRPVADK